MRGNYTVKQSSIADTVESEMCPECGSIRIARDNTRGETICQSCGLVIDCAQIDTGPEWRIYDKDRGISRDRAGPPLTPMLHDMGLNTVIDTTNGKKVPADVRVQFARLKRLHRRIRIRNAAERNLSFALGEIERISSALGLPKSVKESAAVIYRKVVDKGLVRGRSIESVVAATLYTACRQAGVPRTLNEIALYSKVSRKEIGRTYRFITRELGMKLMPTSPADYVPRFCAALKLNGSVQKRAIEIIKKAEEMELLSGRSPTGVAAAAVYIATLLEGEKRTQKEVARATGVTEVTLRNRYKEIAEKMGLTLPI